MDVSSDDEETVKAANPNKISAMKNWCKLKTIHLSRGSCKSLLSDIEMGVVIEGPNDKLRCWGVFGWVGGPEDPEGAEFNKKYERELLEWDFDVDKPKAADGKNELGCHQNALMGQKTEKDKRVSVRLNDDEFNDLSR